MKKFFAEFKKFALRGNVMDLAVAVIIGGAFTSIVTSLTENFINPILTLVTTGAQWNVGASAAAFVTAVINFLITAFVLFCLVRLVNKLTSIGKKPAAPAAPTTKKCPFCKMDIPLDATRCGHCTSQLEE